MRFLVGFVAGIVATLAGLMAVGHFLAVEDPLAKLGVEVMGGLLRPTS